MKILFFALLLFPYFLQGQEKCQGSFTEYYLNSNNIRASFFPRGNKFTDGNSGAFLAPYPSSGRLSTIFASSPWMAGYDDAGNLKMAAETYPIPQNFDFTVGPLNSIGLPYYDECAYFDRAWSVFSEDIALHKQDFYEDFKIDDTIPSIFGWPGRGNPYFERFNGFELPAFDNQGLADFDDFNQDGIYDPTAGDHPVLILRSQYFIPDQMMWMVFNDVDTLNPSGHRPIRVEIQLTAFAFHCQDKAWLNNTIFNKYKIINRAVTPLDSVLFGMWTDYDLGCSSDDFMGSDRVRSTEFVYNADLIDGDAGSDCINGSYTYADRPPVQSMTWLSHPMHGFCTQEHETGFPSDKYQFLNGLWGDGTPIRPEGDGYNEDPDLKPTKFLFNGDPRDTNSWAAINVFSQGKEQRSISSVSLDRFNPGAIREVFTAHMFHYDPNADHLGQITHMYNNVDSLLAMSWHPHEKICNPFPVCMDNDCVWPGDFDKNGIADHRDYLTWGVLNDLTGPGRNGLVSWRGYLGEDWSEDLFGLNAKHADGNGNGIIDLSDIDINTENQFLTNRFYTPEANYPKGSDIVISADPRMDSLGRIRNVSVRAGHNLENVLGITFEIEFDTSLYQRYFLPPNWPDEDASLMNFPNHDSRTFLNTSIVQTNHTGVSIDANFAIIYRPGNALQLRPGASIPDSTIIRLRNLKAIDPEGKDLLLGSEPIIIYRQGFVSTQDPATPKSSVYPNPTAGHICIYAEMETEAELFSIQGHKLRHFNRHDVNRLIDVSEIPPGIYILRIIETGEAIKLMIQ